MIIYTLEIIIHGHALKGYNLDLKGWYRWLVLCFVADHYSLYRAIIITDAGLIISITDAGLIISITDAGLSISITDAILGISITDAVLVLLMRD